MKCSKCGDDVDIIFHQGGSHLCDLCFMSNVHIFYKPNKCRICDKIITEPISLLNTNDNNRFCSLDCLAKAFGFYKETFNTEEIKEVNNNKES